MLDSIKNHYYKAVAALTVTAFAQPAFAEDPSSGLNANLRNLAGLFNTAISVLLLGLLLGGLFIMGRAVYQFLRASKGQQAAQQDGGYLSGVTGVVVGALLTAVPGLILAVNETLGFESLLESFTGGSGSSGGTSTTLNTDNL